jgi:hypothetical protein
MERRAAMFWMLHEAGASCRSEYVTGREPFMGRLRRAGALLGAAEREGGTILKLRFESCSPCSACPISPPGWPDQLSTLSGA